VLARVAPEDCLGYANWAGVAAPDPKSPNQTEQLLAEPEVQNFFVQIDRALRQMVEKHLADQKVEDKQTVRDVMEAWRSVATHPGAIFLSKLELKKAPPDKKPEPDKKPKTAKTDQPTAEATAGSFKDVAEIELGVVLSLGADAPRMEAILNRYVETCRRTAKEKAAKPKTPDKGPAAAKHDGNAPRTDSEIENVKIGDRNGYRVRLDEPAGHCWTCGFHDGYFLLTLGREDAAQRVLERMKAAPPRWWSALREQVPVQRRSLVAYANPRRWGDLVLSHADSTARANARMIVELQQRHGVGGGVGPRRRHVRQQDVPGLGRRAAGLAAADFRSPVEARRLFAHPPRRRLRHGLSPRSATGFGHYPGRRGKGESSEQKGFFAEP
jgi:hypothetical protein